MFDGDAMVQAALTAAVADAPAGVGPLDILWRAFRSFQPMLEDRWSHAKPRQEIISSTPALQERELAKIAALTDALVIPLRARGVANLRATLAAQIGMAAFTHATFAWLDDPARGLGERIDQAFRELKAVLADSD